MDKDDLWIVEHFSELVTQHAGRYVAIVNETLVAVGDSRREVEDKTREFKPAKIPSVLKVPREEDYGMPSIEFPYTPHKGYLMPIIPVYFHNLSLQIGDCQITAPVGFSERLGVGFNLLGRTGVFDQFEVCFNDRARKLTFQSLSST